MRMILSLIFFLNLVSASTSFGAVNCPWEKRSGEELLLFDYSDSFTKAMTQAEVREDLSCLRILFENFYVGREAYPGIDLIKRIAAEIANAVPTTNALLLKRIFGLHDGMVDLHLSYQSNGLTVKLKSLNPTEVKIDEELLTDEIYDRASYVYFKPGRLLPTLSPAQQALADFVDKHDKNLVLDLRGNIGGTDELAFRLAKNIFTKNQNIPQTKHRQAMSPLISIGMCVSLQIHYGDQAKGYCDSIRSSITGRPFSELTAHQIYEKTEKIVGQRAIPFASKIILLTDSKCASSCETIVEKLSAHPNAMIIGSHTAGALHYSNAMSFTLPHSKIWVRIPTLLHVYEREVAEGVGYSPHKIVRHIELSKLPL